MPRLTHLDKNNNPNMVDVSQKNITYREATSICDIYLPISIKEFFSGGDIATKKGGVFASSIIAGTMAVKNTFLVIPLCHSLSIESCKIWFKKIDDTTFRAFCQVSTHSKTGVEMESMHGAMISALNVYDMTKALGAKNITISNAKTVKKIGGKSDFCLDEYESYEEHKALDL
jgi:cyclic pyranopterin phosphate synthase